MQMDIESKIASNIAQLRDAAEALLNLLSEETQALESYEDEHLFSLVKQKEYLTSHIESRMNEILSHVEKNSSLANIDRKENRYRLIFHDSHLQSNWVKAKESLQSCQKKNNLNGQIIALGRFGVEQFLNVVRGNSENTTYDANGQTQTQTHTSGVAKA